MTYHPDELGSEALAAIDVARTSPPEAAASGRAALVDGACRRSRPGHQDIDAIVSDYADDAIFITPDGVLRGTDGVRPAFEKLTSDVPGAQWELPTQIYEDDILLLEWKATSSTSKVEDGIDTCVFRDGLIRVQTVRYTLQAT